VTVPQRGPEYAAICALLRASALIVGEAERPMVDSRLSEAPYVVVYPSIIDSITGPLDDLAADTGSEYLVRSIGRSAIQALAVADKARTVLLGNDLTIPDRSLMRPVEWALAQEVDRDDDTTPPWFYLSERFIFWTTPNP